MLTREILEETLGFRVCNFDTYIRVFTHKSASRDIGTESYERLEFIGDSVINFVVAKYLFDAFPEADEGFLTKVRTRLVCSKTLAEFSNNLGLGRFVIMNERALRQGWNTNTRILEDVFESLVGALYLDLGLHTAKTFLISVIERFMNIRDLLTETNYKDVLMRYVQSKGAPLPNYVVTTPLARQSSLFEVCVVIDGLEGRGNDTCKKGAEQLAALSVLIKLGVIPPPLPQHPPPPLPPPPLPPPSVLVPPQRPSWAPCGGPML
jgi:ribonuclease III